MAKDETSEIRGREYGVSREGGAFFETDARKVRIGDLKLRRMERFAVISGLDSFRGSSTCYLCASPPFVPTHQASRCRDTCKARYPAGG
jgi:hypothetical protein